jgi:hypothetical protein
MPNTLATSSCEPPQIWNNARTNNMFHAKKILNRENMQEQNAESNKFKITNSPSLIEGKTSQRISK